MGNFGNPCTSVRPISVMICGELHLSCRHFSTVDGVLIIHVYIVSNGYIIKCCTQTSVITANIYIEFYSITRITLYNDHNFVFITVVYVTCKQFCGLIDVYYMQL